MVDGERDPRMAADVVVKAAKFFSVNRMTCPRGCLSFGGVSCYNDEKEEGT